MKIKEFVNLYREPVVTYLITPSNAPQAQSDPMANRRGRRYRADFEEDVFNDSVMSDMLLNTINGLFQKFYAPERVRILKNGIKVKMSDVVSYKIIIQNGEMKFYLTVPKKWAKGFISAIKKDWGQVDITPVEEKIIDFNPNKTKAMDVHLRHHYALSIKHEKNQADSFYSSIASLASTLNKDDKVLIDFNVEPTNNMWKEKARKKLNQFKRGLVPTREDALTVSGLIGRTFDMFNIVFEEFVKMIEDLMGAKENKEKEEKQIFELKYSDQKIHANSKGYNVQIRVLAESDDEKKVKHSFRNIETAFSLMDGDNKFTVTNIRTKRGIKSVIKAVENNEPQIGKPADIFFEKEMNNLLRIPSKQTLKEYAKVIAQDNFTRTDIDNGFFSPDNGAIPFGMTLEKEPRRIHFAGYERAWWTEKGRETYEKTRLDDRCTVTMAFGGQGGGKTSLSENQALYTFGAHIQDKEVWKRESKSVVVFDVADGQMITNIYNRLNDWQKERVVVLNHSNLTHPIAVNNSDLDEFNTEIMHDEDYAYTLAEMEAKLVLEILQSDKTLAVDRWFVSALQAVHTVNKDWGYIEAIKVLTDTDFRMKEVLPYIQQRRLKLEIETYNHMAQEGKADKIVTTIENRFAQLERDQKLWDCIAQRPIRDEDGKVKLNFRKMMDGDEDGSYMILIYVPKTGVSEMYRRFIFAHYFTKVWNVLLSREVGFAGREFRPETLVIVDEIHQIIDIPIVAKLFIDIFKEVRKYSGRYLFTLHGWSSLAKAGRGLEGDIKQSIMDNGCNLVMLRGGDEAFDSLSNFLQPMTISDFNNLMNMEFCGIFAVRWKNKNHVMQAKLFPHLGSKKSEFTKYNNYDSNFLYTYCSPFGRSKEEVREDNLNRSFELISKVAANSVIGGINDVVDKGDSDWQSVRKAGTKERKSPKLH